MIRNGARRSRISACYLTAETDRRDARGGNVFESASGQGIGSAVVGSLHPSELTVEACNSGPPSRFGGGRERDRSDAGRGSDIVKHARRLSPPPLECRLTRLHPTP